MDHNVKKRNELVTAMLTLDDLGDDIYRSEGPHIGGVVGPNRLFGGYIAAQVYHAIQEYLRKQNEYHPIFSMHYNFVSAGDPKKWIDIEIKRFDKVFLINTSHEHKRIGIGHVKIENELMQPLAKFPDDAPDLVDVPHASILIESLPTERLRKRYSIFMDKFIFDLKPIHLVTMPAPDEYKVSYYARIHPDSREKVGEENGMVVVVALSDFFVIQSAQNAINYRGLRMETGASLHHKIHFYKQYVEAIQWFFVETRTELASRNKAKIFGHIFDSNRDCIVSYVQEAYVVPGKVQQVNNVSKL